MVVTCPAFSGDFTRMSLLCGELVEVTCDAGGREGLSGLTDTSGIESDV